MNGYYGQMWGFAIVGLLLAWWLSRKDETAWYTKLFGLMLPAAIGGFVLGLFLCLVPAAISYFGMPQISRSFLIEKMPGHHYFVDVGEEDEYGRCLVAYYREGKSREASGTVAYDLGVKEFPYLEERIIKPGWFQRLYPSGKENELVFHVRPLNKDYLWFHDKMRAIKALDSRIEALQVSGSLRGYAPPALVSRADEINKDQIDKLVVQRDILAYSYNKEASRLDKEGFYSQFGGPPEDGLPYQVKIRGQY